LDNPSASAAGQSVTREYQDCMKKKTYKSIRRSLLADFNLMILHPLRLRSLQGALDQPLSIVYTFQ
jgi:hypothetical protein